MKKRIVKIVSREGRRIAMLFGLKFKRKFDGEMYDLSNGGLTKAQAEKYANEMREKGHKVRVIHTRVADWCIYVKRT